MVLLNAIQRVINLVQTFRTEYARQAATTLQKDFKISLGRTPVFTLQWRPVIGFRGVASIAVQQQLHCLHSKVDSYETVAAGSELDRLPILLIFLCVIYSRPCILRKSTSKWSWAGLAPPWSIAHTSPLYSWWLSCVRPISMGTFFFLGFFWSLVASPTQCVVHILKSVLKTWLLCALRWWPVSLRWVH